MALPELPINLDDPNHDIQRDGERVVAPLYDTQRGGYKKSGQPPQADLPQGHTRYTE